MSWDEKYGGIWDVQLRDGESIHSERHLPDRDLVALVIRRVDGWFAVAVLQKVADPQWRLPFWTAIEPAAVVATQADADSYLAGALESADYAG